MNRTLLVISMIALAAAPAAAQGRSNEHRNNGHFRTSSTRNADNRASGDNEGRYRSDDEDDDRDDDDRDDDDRGGRGAKKIERTYIDSRGMECREKTKVKKDGRRSSTTRCSDPKNGNGRWNGRNSRDVNQCAYQDSRCDQLPSTTGGTYPRSRRQPTSTSRQPTMTEILGAIAAQQPRR